MLLIGLCIIPVAASGYRTSTAVVCLPCAVCLAQCVTCCSVPTHACCSSTFQPGQYRYSFESPVHCQVRDRRECERLCRLTSNCSSWSWECSNGGLCCTYGSLSPIFRETVWYSACVWAGSVLAENRSSLPRCTKLVVAPHGHVVALQLPSQERLDVVVTVFDGPTAESPILRPADGRVWSSGRNLRLVLESTRNTSVCGEEAAWRAKVSLEAQRSATTKKSVAPTDMLWRQLIAPAVALVVISWACCSAYYVHTEGTQASAQARTTHQRVELVVSTAERAGISERQMSNLQVVLREYSFVFPPPVPLAASAPYGFAETGATTDDCVICLCTIAPREMATKLRCSHVYHRACIETWLSRTATCPSCRAPVAITENDLTSMMQRGLARLVASEDGANQGNQNVADATRGTWTTNPLFELHSAAIDSDESS